MAREFIAYQATLTIGDDAASFVLLEALKMEMKRLLEEERQAAPQERESVAPFISACAFLMEELRTAWRDSGNFFTEEESEVLTDSI